MKETDRKGNEMEQMTSRQSFAIKCASNLDVRELEISYDEASNIIKTLNKDEEFYALQVEDLLKRGAKGTPKPFKKYEGKKSKGTKATKKIQSTLVKPKKKSKDQAHQELYDRADKAGREAAEACTPVPMHVVERANPLDDSSPIVKQYAPVMSGVCGFAWVSIKPATSSFAKWLKKNELGRPDSYYGGLTVWVSNYGQSMEKKEAYAGAFAQVLRDAGFKAYSMSRMD
jgi:hypothetical protein